RRPRPLSGTGLAAGAIHRPGGAVARRARAPLPERRDGRRRDRQSARLAATNARGGPCRDLRGMSAVAAALAESMPALVANGAEALRVLYLSDVYFPRVNGVSTSIDSFRHELARLGHEVTVA